MTARTKIRRPTGIRHPENPSDPASRRIRFYRSTNFNGLLVIVARVNAGLSRVRAELADAGQHVARAADEHVARSASDPKEVAVAVQWALEAKRPSFRYPVGPLSRIGRFAKGKVPSNLLQQG